MSLDFWPLVPSSRESIRLRLQICRNLFKNSKPNRLLYVQLWGVKIFFTLACKCVHILRTLHTYAKNALQASRSFAYMHVCVLVHACIKHWVYVYILSWTHLQHPRSGLSKKMQWYWPFFKAQFIHVLWDREWDSKTKIASMFFFVLKITKIPLRAEFSPLLKKVNVNVQNLNFMLILILNDYFRKSAPEKVRPNNFFIWTFFGEQFLWIIFL